MQRDSLRILPRYLIGIAILLKHSEVAYLIATRMILLSVLASVNSYRVRWNLNLLGCS